MVQIGQRHLQCLGIGAVERGDAEQNLDLAFQHIIRQSVPQVKHRGAAAQAGTDTGPAQFQQSPPRGFQPRQVIFGFGIEPPRLCRPFRWHQAVDATDMLFGCRVDRGVNQDQMIEIGIKFVPLQPRYVVDHGTVATQFFDKDFIAQPLRCAHVGCITGQPQDERMRIRNHCSRSSHSWAARHRHGQAPSISIRALQLRWVLGRRLGQCNPFVSGTNGQPYAALRHLTHSMVVLNKVNRPAAMIIRGHRSNIAVRTTRDPSMTTLPHCSKFTVMRPAMLDCTWPMPQSGSPGWRTSIPGSSMSFSPGICSPSSARLCEGTRHV